ncbi:metal-dependent hydrolase family protein [Abyssisolibacter fermentans]|uniref:metal-dependent hydrolase family protein n=1 Tax=Abyssisolibacter fermentans TaxID=1766203 RepID=UPI000832B3D5|nr:amidohydrolase family protein [Abyssisolibacter fermentans]
MKKSVIKGRVIDATGSEPIENGVVVIEGNKIIQVGSEESIEFPKDAEIIEIEEGTIMPGLIDAHVHIGLGTDDVRRMYDKSMPEKTCIAIKELEACIDAGFTSVREVGGFLNTIKTSLEMLEYKAPRIASSGRFITQTNGHADMYKRFPLEMQESTGIGIIADGVDECIKAARLQFREGADFLKIGTTGGGTSQGDKLSSCEYTMEEIKALVQEAKNNGTYVASHAHTITGIKNAIRGGVKSIEHCTMVDDEAIQMLLDNDCYFVPTLSVGQSYLDGLDSMPLFVQEKVAQLGDPERGLNMCEFAGERYAKAFRAGVKMGLGSDLLGDPKLPYGKNAREFELLVQYLGITPMEAIIVGTKNNSELMMMEDKIGTLEEGKLADVIVVKGNPLEDISLLTNSDNIKIVIKDGKIQKNIA